MSQNVKLAQNSYKESILQTLKEICTKKTPVVIWKFGLDRKWSAVLELKIVRSQQNEALFIVSGDQEEAIKKVITGEKSSKFYIEQGNILFQANIKTFYGNELVIELPKFIAIQERRQYMRLLNENPKNILIFNTLTQHNVQQMKSFQKTIHDLSAGGMSIILSLQEKELVPVSDQILHCMAYVDGECIVSSMKLIGIIEIPSNSSNGLLYKSYKASFKFMEISENHKNFINDYVLKHYKLSA